MIAWLLSRLFSTATLAKAVTLKPEVLRCNVFTEYEFNEMIDASLQMFQRPGLEPELREALETRVH